MQIHELNLAQPLLEVISSLGIRLQEATHGTPQFVIPEILNVFIRVRIYMHAHTFAERWCCACARACDEE